MDWFNDNISIRQHVTIALLTLIMPVLASACSESQTQEREDPTPVFSNSLSNPAKTPTHAKVTRAIDGITIEVVAAGITYIVRYLGLTQPDDVHMKTALEYNTFIVDDKIVTLASDTPGIDVDGALLRYVYVDGEMVNLKLLFNGWAKVNPVHGSFQKSEEFFAAESLAQSNKQGIWKGGEKPPAETITPTQPVTSGDSVTGSTLPPRPKVYGIPSSLCDFSNSGAPVIKGNVDNRTGSRIYHVPGGLFYASITIDPGLGDQWLCTENEAEELGWVRSKR